MRDQGLEPIAGMPDGRPAPFAPGRCVAMLLLFVCVAVTPLRAADLTLYDDDADAQWSQLERVTEVVGTAYEGSRSLRVEPTRWHQPLLRIPQRTDFRPYDVLELSIRSASGPITQGLVLRDQDSGTRVDLARYVEGGRIDERWRKVRIPVADLASERFSLGTVYTIVFDKMAEPQAFFVDSIRLRKTSGPQVAGYHLRSDRALTITADAFDHAASANPERYRVSSDADPDYRSGVAPVAVGSDRQAVGVTDDGSAVVVESRLHLLLPKPLRAGQSYRVSVAGLVGENGIGARPTELEVRFDPDAVSSSIRVNQVGYAPNAPKIAYIGNWLGDLGPMPVAARQFTVANRDTGESVFTGELELRAGDDPQSGEDVYEADFSPVIAPGRYQVRVDGIGRSDPFLIAPDVYEPVYRTVMRFFYHKRNTGLVSPYADPGFERDGIDPSLDGVFHPVLADYPLSSGEVPFGYRPIVKGWFDAGDYGQYVHNAAPIWLAVGLAFDLSTPCRFMDGELNIPESGNGVPDLIDELGWGMDWALSMQDEDGGVYWRLASGEFDLGLPTDVSKPRFIYEKTTRATAQLAAMGAIYARLIEPYDTTRSVEVLAAAERAWGYVRTHPVWPAEGQLYRNPAEHPGGGEYAVRSSKPDMLWAAAELYRTTGDAAYQDAYRTLVRETSIDVTGAPETTRAHWAMAKVDHPDRDPVLVEEARRAIMIAADVKLAWSEQSPFRVPKHPSIELTGWHNFSGAVTNALALLQAHHLSGDEVYERMAWLMPNATLGANPLAMSFITGIGARAPRDPMDRISLLDQVDEPVRGMPVPGPTWHLPAFREPYISANRAYYPPEEVPVDRGYRDAYPVLRRYADAHALIPMNEGTVREAALTAAAFGLLSDGDAPPVVADPPYDWSPDAPKRAQVLHLTDIPLAEVALLTPAQITAFGASVGLADPDWLRALSAEQVAGIDAPTTPYWVAKLERDQQLALTPGQIVGFEHWSLFTALPAERVPQIPVEKIAMLGTTIVNTSDAWKAALTPAQLAAMSAEQREIISKALGSGI